jgi:nucleoside-diphosphate-sugar epimerase
MDESLADPAPLLGRRIAVTGASGFIGSKLVDRLCLEGARVAALARTRGMLASSSSPAGFDFFTCDVRDPAQIRRALHAFEPEIVYHFATHPDGRESAEQARAAIETNVAGTLHTLEAFRAAKGSLFLYGDSCKVYGNSPVPHRESSPLDPTSSYATSKAAGWHLSRLHARLYGFAAVSLRPTLIYGPTQARNVISFAIERMLEGDRILRLDGGNQTRDPLFVDDAIDAFVAAARRGRALNGRVVALGGGREITVLELVRTIARLFDREVEVIACAKEARPTEMWRSFCDNREAASMLGWKPKIDLESGLSLCIQASIVSRS